MDNLKDIIDILFKFIPLVAAGVALYTWRGNAAAKFRSAIDPEIATRFNGYALGQALLGARAGNGETIEGVYFKHRRAYQEFRRFLGPVGRRKIDKAWGEYTGEHEGTPNFLDMYCTDARSASGELSEKQELLKTRLEKFHDLSTIWY